MTRRQRDVDVARSVPATCLLRVRSRVPSDYGPRARTFKTLTSSLNRASCGLQVVCGRARLRGSARAVRSPSPTILDGARNCLRCNALATENIGPELLAGAVETLRRWSKVWPARPIAVAAAPAFAVEMAANRALAQHIGAIGKLPVLELFEWHGDQLQRDTSSGPIVGHLQRSVQRNQLSEVPRGPILLCAASMRTGWTLAVCAALLFEENNALTLPLVIHRLP